MTDTNNLYPITPPPELVEQWWEATVPNCGTSVKTQLCTQAAQWGANQELDACCEWLQDPDLNVDTYKLRAARRPKPPSLKEQALDELTSAERLYPADWSTIRKALEALPNE